MNSVTRGGRYAVCTTAIAVSAVALSAQQRPRFTSNVDVVSVDVNVIANDGRPVRDLTAGDFTVTVDGQRRSIVSAQFISLTAPPATPDAPAPSSPDYSTNVAATPGRLIAVVLDRGSIAPVRAKDVIAAAARFVGSLQPQDRVGLFSIP